MTPSDRPRWPRVEEASVEVAQRKDALRTAARAARATLVVDADATARLTQRALAACAGHDRVALHLSVAPEPDTAPLVAALRASGVRVLLPVLAGRRTPAWAWDDGPDAVRAGWRGIPEPTGPVLGPDAVAQVTFVWATALAVTPDGRRLGTGGGWYDRALAAACGVRVGVLVHDHEVIDDVPTHAWDRRVDVIVTPERTLLVGGE